jgi:hypothetical protein
LKGINRVKERRSGQIKNREKVSVRDFAFSRFLFGEHLCRNHLFAFPSLMPRSGQQLAVFMLTHLFSSLFDNATQPITSFDNFFYGKNFAN